METIDKRTKEYKDSQKIELGDVGSLEEVLGDEPVLAKLDYSKREHNPGWKLCSTCGVEHSPNDAGIVVSRKWHEKCRECVWAEKGFMIKDGKRLPIPPKEKK